MFLICCILSSFYSVSSRPESLQDSCPSTSTPTDATQASRSTDESPLTEVESSIVSVSAEDVRNELREAIMNAGIDDLLTIFEDLRRKNSNRYLDCMAWAKASCVEDDVIMSPKILCRLAEVYGEALVSLDLSQELSLKKFLGFAVDAIGKPGYPDVLWFMKKAQEAGVNPESFEDLMQFLCFDPKGEQAGVYLFKWHLIKALLYSVDDEKNLYSFTCNPHHLTLETTEALRKILELMSAFLRGACTHPHGFDEFKLWSISVFWHDLFQYARKCPTSDSEAR